MTSTNTMQNHRLDPKIVHPSRWANRDEGSFQGPAWEEFKSEIVSAGGNVQPIKVRRSVLQKNAFEIVFGHRRHRACLELGITVLAFCDELSDKQLFEEMDRENRQRANLSPYEQGQMYCRALDEGLYPSLRKLVESLGGNLGNTSAYIRLARLPHAVVSAFESSLHIQQRWSGPLAAALLKSPDGLLAVAMQILLERKQGRKVASSEAFRRMVGMSDISYASPRQVPLPGGICMQVTRGRKVRFEFDALDKSSSDQIERAILEVLSLQASAGKSENGGDLFDLAGAGK